MIEFNKVVAGKTLLDQLADVKKEIAESKKKLDELEVFPTSYPSSRPLV